MSEINELVVETRQYQTEAEPKAASRQTVLRHFGSVVCQLVDNKNLSKDRNSWSHLHVSKEKIHNLFQYERQYVLSI